MFESSFDWWMLILTVLNVVIIGGFSLLRTYYQRRALKVQEQILRESREYWNSWQTRSQNIALEVREKIGNEKNNKSKRTRRRNKSNRNKTQRDRSEQA